MSILVTGAAGFLGSVLVRRLLRDAEHPVRCLVRPGGDPSRLLGLRAQSPAARMEIVDGNLTRPEDARRAIEGAVVVYHAAARLRGAPADMFLDTVVGTENLAKAALEGGRPRIVLVSSIAVYGTASLPQGTVLDETTPLEPRPQDRDPYAQAKLRQESLLWEYRRVHGLPLVVARPGVIYGPGDNRLPSRVGLRVGGVVLHLGGRSLLPLSFVENCADALVLVGRASATEGQAFNIHDDDLPTCREALPFFRAALGDPPAVRVPSAIARALARLVAAYSSWSRNQIPPFMTPYGAATLWGSFRYDNNKLKSMGWRPRISTTEGLRRAFGARATEGRL